MTGLLYSVEYIEEHFPSFVQKYKNCYGEPEIAISGFPTDDFNKKNFWGKSHKIIGPINNPEHLYNGCYIIKDDFPAQFYNRVIPSFLFEHIEKDEKEEKEKKKTYKVAVRKVTNQFTFG